METCRRAFIRRLAVTSAVLIGGSRSSIGRGDPPRRQAVTPRRSPSTPPASPAILSGIPEPGTFVEFTLNKPSDLLAVDGTPQFYYGILANWCGGAFINDFGAMGAAVYHGGGEHFSNNDRGGVLVLDCAARRYVARCVPTSTKHMNVAIGANGAIAGSQTNAWGAYADDGYPSAMHTYNSLTEFPKSWGGGPMGSLVRVSHSGGYQNPIGQWPGLPPTNQYGLAATWAFDLSRQRDGCTRLTGDQTYDFGSGKPAVVNDAVGTCMDWRREGWWSYARTGSGHGDRFVFTHKSGRIDPPMLPRIALAWGRLHHFADDDTLCAVAGGAPTTVVIIDLSAVMPQWKGVTLNGSAADLALFNSRYGGYIGFQWCSILDCLIGIHAWPLSSDTSRVGVWKIIPPETAAKRWTDPWRLELEILTSADGSQIDMTTDHAVNSGTSYGKLVECKALRSLVWTRRIDRRGQLLRLRGM